MLDKAIYISIKPKYTNLIEVGKKDHEFRKYIPKQKIDTLLVYETSPLSRLTYIIEIGNITKFPDKINSYGYTNTDFNDGLKDSKYAYYIKKVYKLNNPILLNELRQYGFTAPERFVYAKTYNELTKYISKQSKKLIIDRSK